MTTENVEHMQECCLQHVHMGTVKIKPDKEPDKEKKAETIEHRKK